MNNWILYEVWQKFKNVMDSKLRDTASVWIVLEYQIQTRY